MNIADLATVFEGLTKGFGGVLKDKDKKELNGLVAMLQRFPGQSVSDFVKFVDGAFSKERKSIPALVERLRTAPALPDQDKQELKHDVGTLGATDLKKLVVAMGQKAAARKDENLHRVLRFMGEQTSEHVPIASSDLNAVALGSYESLKSEIPRISVDDVYKRYDVLVEGWDKSVFVSVLKAIGYTADGTKDLLRAQLLDNLMSIKISKDQTAQIR